MAFRLEENRWNGTVAPQLVVRRIFDADERFLELRAWLANEWKAAAAERSADAVAIFAELGFADGAPGRRHLLESERFRALLADGGAGAR